MESIPRKSFLKNKIAIKKLSFRELIFLAGFPLIWLFVPVAEKFGFDF